MAKAKKTKKQEVVEPVGEITLKQSEKLEQCEWVFQFDDDEPQVFAWTSEDMTNEEPTVTFTLTVASGSGNCLIIELCARLSI